MASLPYQSTEYISTPIQMKVDGDVIDPTGFTIEFSLTATSATEPGAWVAGIWGSSATRYYGKVLVGPGGSVDPGEAGTKMLWVRITAAPEAIIRKVGQIHFT